MLKSALEINHGKINPIRGKISDSFLRSSHAESAPKLNNKNVSQPSFIEVLDEVSGKYWIRYCLSFILYYCKVCNLKFDIQQDIEPTVLSKDKKKHHQSGLLYSNKTSGDIEMDGLRNYLRVKTKNNIIKSMHGIEK